MVFGYLYMIYSFQTVEAFIDTGVRYVVGDTGVLMRVSIAWQSLDFFDCTTVRESISPCFVTRSFFCCSLNSIQISPPKCLYNAGRQPDYTSASCGRQKFDLLSGDFVAVIGAIYACDFLGLLGFVLG